MHIYGWALVAVIIAMFVGATLQGIIGFGMIAIAFPVLVIANEALLPQSVLIVAIPVTSIMLVRNWAGVVWSEVGWIGLGRIPGIGLAIVLLRTLSASTLALGGGLMVLAAVGVSLWAPPVSHTRTNLATVGVLSGLFGTALAIGGPPLGLLYQHESGARLRSTVSVLMMMGAPVYATILLATGDMNGTDIRTGLALIPGAVLGVTLAPKAHAYFDDRLRTLVLSACAVSAVAAMAKIAVL